MLRSRRALAQHAVDRVSSRGCGQKGMFWGCVQIGLWLGTAAVCRRLVRVKAGRLLPSCGPTAALRPATWIKDSVVAVRAVLDALREPACESLTSLCTHRSVPSVSQTCRF